MRRCTTLVRARCRTNAVEDERGFVLVTSAIVLVVLLLFGGLAVDVTAWYARASQIEHAADAGALAGVVWMPDLDAARAAAVDAVARNGFRNGVDGISVSVDSVTGNSRRLRVTVKDAQADQYLSRVAVTSPSIQRSSTAEYVQPVPLGSPKNVFGTGDLLAGSDAERFWASVSGYCSGHESGDRRLARYESYSTASGTSQCNNGSPQSPDYDASGYLYAINLPLASTQLRLEVYDAPFYTSGSTPDAVTATGTQTLTTIFEIYDRSTNSFDLSNLTLLKTVTLPANSAAATYQNKWAPFYTWTNPQAGTYYLRVRTPAGELNSRATNGFGIRAFTGSTFALCTTIAGATGYSASCPEVHGVTDMSIFANGASSTADFYLAEVDAVHAGKTMRVTLFDAGEGSTTLRLIDPNGNAVTFWWSTACNPPTPPAGACSGSGSSLDVTGTGPQPFAGLVADAKYNDRSLILDVPLPANYATLYGTKRWWKVRYTAGTTPKDRTTWSVSIVGDPVHLVS